MAPSLYWSHIETYEECPQKFLWKSGWGVIDLGRGPGKGKKRPDDKKKSEHSAVMGNVLSDAIERLYNDELWRDPPTLIEKLSEIVRKSFALRMSKAHINYDDNWFEGKNEKWDVSPPKGALLQTCLDGAINYLRTMKRNRLLGPYAKSEVDLSGMADKVTPIAGRPDIIVRRDDNGVTILDGKNAKNPGKYTNPDQLKWYALCFYLAYHTIPTRLAFVYFRYPEGSPPLEIGTPLKPYEGAKEDWTGLVEIPYKKEDLKLLAHRAVQTRKVMLKEYFEPTPSTKACLFCDFQSVCPAFTAWKEGNKRKPKEPKEGLEKTLDASIGFVSFGGFEPTEKP